MQPPRAVQHHASNAVQTPQAHCVLAEQIKACRLRSLARSLGAPGSIAAVQLFRGLGGEGQALVECATARHAVVALSLTPGAVQVRVSWMVAGATCWGTWVDNPMGVITSDCLPLAGAGSACRLQP